MACVKTGLESETVENIGLRLSSRPQTFDIAMCGTTPRVHPIPSPPEEDDWLEPEVHQRPDFCAAYCPRTPAEGTPREGVGESRYFGDSFGRSLGMTKSIPAAMLVSDVVPCLGLSSRPAFSSISHTC